MTLCLAADTPSTSWMGLESPWPDVGQEAMLSSAGWSGFLRAEESSLEF